MITIYRKETDGTGIRGTQIVSTIARSSLETWIIRSVVLMGLIFVATGWGMFARNQAIISRGVPVDGQVIELVESVPTPKNGTTRPRKVWAPRFAYQFQGREYSYLSPFASSFFYYPLDAPARFFILPENPEILLINDFRHRWLLPLVFSLSGLATLFAGCGAGFLFRKSPRLHSNR